MTGPAFRAAARRRVAVLKNRSFRRLLVGHAVSVLGDGLYGVAGARFGSRTVMLASALGSVLAACYWFVVPELRRFGPPTSVSSGQFG